MPQMILLFGKTKTFGKPVIYYFLFYSILSSGISHSVTSDMQTIEQESPTLAKPRKKYQEDPEDSYFSSQWSEQSSRYGCVRGWP